MPDNLYLSNIVTPDGKTVWLKDKEAREAIAGGVSYIGKLWIGTGSTHMTDGDTRTSVEIVDPQEASGHKTVAAMSGNLIIDTVDSTSSEFIYDGSTWQKFGDGSFSDLGDLAFADTASGTVTINTYGNPTPNNTSTAATVNIAENASGNLAITGTFTNPTFSTTATLTGTATLSQSSEDYKVVAATSIPSGATKSYTPAGTVAAPTISLATAGSTTSINNPTSKTVVTNVGTSAPSSTAASGALTYCSYDSTTECMTFSQITKTTGASITTSATTVKTGDASYSASAPAFTGTDVYLYADDVQTTAGTAPVTVSGTVSGNTTGGAFTPKKYQVGVNYEKTTSVTQGTAGTASRTVTVTPD